MNIRQRQSNFSQFSNDLWLIAEHDDVNIKFDVDETELAEFAIMLLNIADDCMLKKGCDMSAEASKTITEAMNMVWEIMKKEERGNG